MHALHAGYRTAVRVGASPGPQGKSVRQRCSHRPSRAYFRSRDRSGRLSIGISVCLSTYSGEKARRESTKEPPGGRERRSGWYIRLRFKRNPAFSLQISKQLFDPCSAAVSPECCVANLSVSADQSSIIKCTLREPSGSFLESQRKCSAIPPNEESVKVRRKKAIGSGGYLDGILGFR